MLNQVESVDWALRRVSVSFVPLEYCHAPFVRVKPAFCIKEVALLRLMLY
jgi:hypothetical protein